MQELLKVYAVYLLVLSIITFIAYGLDKRKAVKGKWRISEKILLGMSLLGGAFGGLLGMLKFRHKTTSEHWYFTLLNVLGVLAHIGLAVYLVSLV